jgi:DnaJ-class molecular chaperone
MKKVNTHIDMEVDLVAKIDELESRIKVYCSKCFGSMEERYANDVCPNCNGKWLTMEEYITHLKCRSRLDILMEHCTMVID